MRRIVVLQRLAVALFPVRDQVAVEAARPRDTALQKREFQLREALHAYSYIGRSLTCVQQWLCFGDPLLGSSCAQSRSCKTACCIEIQGASFSYVVCWIRGHNL